MWLLISVDLGSSANHLFFHVSWKLLHLSDLLEWRTFLLYSPFLLRPRHDATQPGIFVWKDVSHPLEVSRWVRIHVMQWHTEHLDRNSYKTLLFHEKFSNHVTKWHFSYLMVNNFDDNVQTESFVSIIKVDSKRMKISVRLASRDSDGITEVNSEQRWSQCLRQVEFRKYHQNFM